MPNGSTRSRAAAPILGLAMALALAVVASSASVGRTDDPGPTWAFVGGRWFEGRRFVERTLYAVRGRFTEDRPPTVDSTLELSGTWIVPPFGEAHNHNLEDSRLDAVAGTYLEEGIFYVTNPDAIPRFVDDARALASRPETVDGVFAQGGWTGPGGHPVGLFERNLKRGVFEERDGEGAFFRVARSPADVAAKWADFLADRPDIVKVYLLYSGLPRDSLPDGWRGLDPGPLSTVVHRAHASGLRVTAHVETAADFRTAVAAGVDQIAHLPGFRPDPWGRVPTVETHGLTSADARQAAERGVTVVTTASFVSRADGPPERIARWREVVVANLTTLRDAGVRLAIGSDDYESTSRPEAEWLASLDAFSPAEVLRMWSTSTPKAIFPERRIGVFEEGTEATFLALRADPLTDFSATGDIAVRFKQGRRLGSPDDRRRSTPPGGG